MEKQELIRLIVEKVGQKLEALGEQVSEQDILSCMGLADSAAADCTEEKPGILVLTAEHGTDCHALYDCPELKKKFRMGCALLQEYAVDLDDYEAVILFDLTNEALSKLYNGIGDTPYTALAMKALLSGKKLYVIREEVELFRYKETAPAPYYEMMKKKLAFLTECGLTICCRDKIAGVLLEQADSEEIQPEDTCCEAPGCESIQVIPEKAPEAPKQPAEKELTLSKKVITERDIIEAGREKVTRIHVKQNAIITDLAKDTANKRDIRLLRD